MGELERGRTHSVQIGKANVERLAPRVSGGQRTLYSGAATLVVVEDRVEELARSMVQSTSTVFGRAGQVSEGEEHGIGA